MTSSSSKANAISGVRGIASPQGSLPPSTRIGTVRLAVSDLHASIRFYRDVIGLDVHGLEGESSNENKLLARLGLRGGSVLLELQELPGVNSIAPHTRLGLYHTAILLPNRSDLGSFIRHLYKIKFPFGSADHGVSEALYLVDPDGLTVEVYADRPRSVWKYEANLLVGAIDPLDTDALKHIPGPVWNGVPVGTSLGHVHFYVSDLHQGLTFYHQAMGLDIMTSVPGALFVSAGGYHHHVGFNVWAAGSPPASPLDARILSWELVVPDALTLAELSQRLRHVASMNDESNADAPTYTDHDGVQVILRSSSTEQ
jgi:catechol 2,3-dioxygenase